MKGQPLWAVSMKRSRSCSITRRRPKKTAACSSSNGFRPRNGEPFEAGGQVTEASPLMLSFCSHCRICDSTWLSKSSVVSKDW
jgi:hypothetical protein